MPFDPNRKFDRCVLCGGAPVTREHLFGRSLAEKFAIDINAQGTGRAGDGSPRILNAGLPMLSAVSLCLCRVCNTNRFSAVMARVQPVLEALAKGEKSEISEAEKTDLLMYFERLGFLVDALSSNYELTDKYRATRHFAPHEHWHQHPPYYSLAQRLSWLDGDPESERPQVFIGRHLGVLGLNPHVNMTRQGGPWKPGANLLDSPTAGHQFLMAVGQLAFFLEMGRPSPNGPPSDAFFELAPTPAPIRWPARRDVDYEDFLRLYQPDLDVLNAREIYGDPDTRAREELRQRELHAQGVASAKQRAENDKGRSVRESKNPDTANPPSFGPGAAET